MIRVLSVVSKCSFKGLCGSPRVCSTNKNCIESIRGDRWAAWKC